MKTTRILVGIFTITIALLARVQAQVPAFVTVSAPNYAAYSTNGINWSASTLPSSGTWVGVAYGNGLFVASAQNSAQGAYSTNGINWSASALPFSGTWNFMTYGNGTFVVVAAGTNQAAFSTNGITWTACTMPSSAQWQSVAYGDGVFVAIAYDSASAAYSTNGIAWTAATLPASTGWYALGYGNGTFVTAAGGTTAAAYSTNGITWTATTLGLNNWAELAYGNGVFAAIAYESASAAYSTNGITWTASTMPSSAPWYSVAYATVNGTNGVFAAVPTASSASAYSDDGIHWTASPGGLPNSGNWYSVAGRQVVSPSATAVATVAGGFVVGAIITDGGSGYTNAPLVAIVGGGGTGAAAAAVVSNGMVTGITINETGSNYSSTPNIIINSPTPAAAAVATVVNGFVVGATITAEGNGYTNGSPVAIVGGGGAGATASAVVTNGVLIGIMINEPGSNYSGTPNIYLYAPLSITSQPQSVAVHAFANASFSVAATASGLPLSYQWSFNNSNIAGATSNSLIITNVVQTNLGAYAVVVTDPFGSVAISNATLEMYPYLTVPFGGLVTNWGDSLALSVQAWGTGPLSYQWLDDGVAITNATNQVLNLSNIQFTNAGLYSVVVSNFLGSVTNTPEEVVVNPAGVSLGLYPGVTINGVAGYNYIIQSSINLNDTNSWVTLTNLTLSQPIQLFVDTNTDASLPANPYHFYRVLPGQ
jgi:hypothetical protein